MSRISVYSSADDLLDLKFDSWCAEVFDGMPDWFNDNEENWENAWFDKWLIKLFELNFYPEKATNLLLRATEMKHSHQKRLLDAGI